MRSHPYKYGQNKDIRLMSSAKIVPCNSEKIARKRIAGTAIAESKSGTGGVQV